MLIIFTFTLTFCIPIYILLMWLHTLIIALGVITELTELFNILQKTKICLIFAAEIQYTNDILAMLSPESEKVSLGKVTVC